MKDIVQQALQTALSLINSTNLSSIDDLEKSSANCYIDDNHYIFMTFGYKPDLTEIWLWFSIEHKDRGPYEDSLDEQDTADLSSESITYNLKILLDRFNTQA